MFFSAIAGASALLAATLQAPATPVPAALLPAAVSVSQDGASLLIDGAIEAGTAERFARAAAGAPRARTVVLHSSGGRVDEAERIADLVRRRGLDTYVETVCLSACTMILLSGRDRAVSPAARIGFHAPAWRGPGRAPPPTVTMRAAREFFAGRGVATGFIDRVLATPHSAIWYPTYAEMLAAGVVNRQTLGGETQAIFSTLRSPDDLRASLRGAPYWRAIEARYPAIADRAVAAAWAARGEGRSDGQIGDAFRAVLIDATPTFMRNAPGDVLDEFLRLVLDQSRVARSISYEACNRLAEGRLHAGGVLPAAMLAREMALIEQAIAAPPREDAIDAVAADRLLERVFEEMPAEQVAALSAMEGEGADPGDPNLCDGVIGMYDRIAAMPERERRLAMRHLLTAATEAQAGY